MKIDEQYIRSLPITTNKIDVKFDRNLFFSKFAVVSYYGTDRDFKNLAYEQLAEIPTLSVTGIRAKWSGLRFQSTHFFILVRKGDENEILNSLRKYEHIRSQIDTLEEYDERLIHRIIASLAINSLGKRKNGKMMYNDGSLMVCDDKNFNMPKSRKELVCLKIEVNEYMNLTARTTSFSNPASYKELRKHKNCAFSVATDVGGFLWEGNSVKPIVIKDFKDGDYNLKEVFVLKKRFSDNKNTVPYWPYNKENYTHGKLYVLWQVVNSVNENFKGIIEIEFCDKDIILYDECRTGNEMLSFMQEYLSGKSIYIEDPFNVAATKKIIKQFQHETRNIVGDSLVFSTKPECNEMVLKICEPKDGAAIQTHYTKSLYRMAHCGNALQHLIFHDNDKEDNIDKTRVRRILIELLVKDALINRRMPQPLSELVQDWTFYRYKINEGNVHGASFFVSGEGKIIIQEYGLSQNVYGEDFNNFVHEHFKYNDIDKLLGGRDYMAMIKNDNVYLIIDTEEIPILDIQLIDAGYDKVVNGGETVAMFKRKKKAHEYLRGYIGFHLWRSDGLNGEPDGAFSYLSGTNSENMQIMQSTKMDRMPRARRIFVLHKGNADMIESNIREIASMLKFGFGRWNELMTHPFPFKFLQEYLDDACETAFSKHWSEITYKGEL